MIIGRIPVKYPPPVARPTFHEPCPCGSTYVAGTPDPELLRTWRLAHAKHWEDGDE